VAATVIDGAFLALGIRARLRERVGALGRLKIQPGLAAVRVGEDPASELYVRNKIRACTEAGVRSEVHALPADCPEGVLRDALDSLNRDARIHGILLQLPLPAHLDGIRIADAIAPEKDVDGFTRQNLGALVTGQPLFEPCTPAGVIHMLEYAGIRIAGAKVVVIGRSTIVGKPLALMLISRGATVTVCHSQTRDLSSHTRSADILVAAAGRAGLVTAGMIKPGAAVIDVGINRRQGKGITGDVDYHDACDVAGWITPVPGGVGPMTVAMLIGNTVLAAERRAGGAYR
jgi:methylenetetrahydrofolate dehydrogenase (NADP+) / methenyltetrahydrofolate cyclohydrolase